MKIDVVKQEKNELHISVDTDMGFLNMINEKLWEQKGLQFAAHRQQHPYISKPELIIKGGNPKKLLLSAVKNADSDFKEIAKLFKHALK